MRRRSVRGLWSIAGALPAMLLIVGPVTAAEGPAAQRARHAEYVSQALKAETEGKNSRREARLAGCPRGGARLRGRPLAQRIRLGGPSLDEVR